MIVLNFHGIGDPQQARRELEPSESRVWISVQRFEQILDGISTLGDVMLTFDDGNETDVSIALPRLIERSLTASFFLLSDRIDTPGSVCRDGVLALIDAGMAIGVHGKAHRAWALLAYEELKRDITEGKHDLETLVGSPLNSAACPFGSYNRRVLSYLREQGMTSVYTSDAAICSRDAWQRARFSVHDTDTIETIRAQVQSAQSPLRILKDRARILVKALR